MKLNKVHHIALIVSDYEKSKHFYTEILGLEIIQETYRETRDSFKLDLALDGQYTIELFSFPDYVVRPSYPEALGLRHLAFEVDDLQLAKLELHKKNIVSESIRTDENTGKRFLFFSDPDGLPIEFYEK
ncbi:SMU1112c/YaeR family gloxylase I-like metalloprotein [Sphingobacterium composti Ten et al. 2007 non Yoo et al. 2007]|uniref:SMU1112c/YaeR family gloxylase I-like metalloprotein n=1 Tax=Sphingobacterium composti TaxID=363260 RepID=UPI001358542A|nr:VOC family protein [Sphingobacterium composti Ten et al. 2007 non Yoo et al. 2007]